MKFTKEKAYKELVAKLTENGEALNISEKTLDGHIENLMSILANEDTELNDFVEKSFPFLKRADDQARYDNSEKIKAGIERGIEEYKKSHPLKVDNVNPQENELEQRLRALEDKEKAFEHDKYVSSTKKSLASKLKEKGVKNEKWIDSLIGEINITEDFDVDEKAESYLSLYNSMMSSYNPNVTPHSPKGGEDKYTLDTIKAASQIAKSHNLAGIE